MAGAQAQRGTEVFGEVIADTPATVPFWEGESLYPILFKPIPRFIMPDIPAWDLARWLAAFTYRQGCLISDRPPR